MSTKKVISKKKTGINTDKVVTIKQFVKARKLPLYMNDILCNYINKSEHEGFPKTVVRTILEWDAVCLKMNNEKA